MLVLFYLAIKHSHILDWKVRLRHKGVLLTEKLNEITLKFLTKIEETSSFTLTNSSNEKVNVEDITVSHDLLTGKVTESLANGAYQINWKIIGADGHPIEGVIDFVLDAPEEEEAVEKQLNPLMK